jgi:hypothetical protein
MITKEETPIYNPNWINQNTQIPWALLSSPDLHGDAATTS